MSVGAERQSSGVWGKVLIAAVLLAIIGGSTGWLLAEWQRAQDGRGIESQGGSPDTGDGTGEDGSGDGGASGGTGGGSDDGDGRAEPEATGDCPAVLVRQVAAAGVGTYGELRLLLHLRTENSDVWICGDGEQLFYQGYRGPSGGEFTDDNSLFLTDVVAEGDHYRATNTSNTGTTTYLVSRTELVISDGAGERREHAVG